MEYIITFLEGIISFISPCILPMIPIYISYFTGDINNKKTSLPRAIAFVLGFTLIFCMLGVFAGTIGHLLKENQNLVNIICGSIVILFGLSYLGVIKISLLKGINRTQKIKSVFSAFVFGIIFSLNLTPCVGAFLGSALMMASVSGTMVKGLLLLLTYSIGLGVPFILSALLIEKLSSAFDFVKKHYKIINTISGVFLVIIGVLMCFGIMNELMYMFA